MCLYERLSKCCWNNCFWAFTTYRDHITHQCLCKQFFTIYISIDINSMVRIVLLCKMLNTQIPWKLSSQYTASIGLPFLFYDALLYGPRLWLSTFYLNYLFFLIVPKIDKLSNCSQTIAIFFSQQQQDFKYLYNLKWNFPEPKFPGAQCWAFDMLMREVMEFGNILFKGNSLVYEAIVLMYNPILHLFFPFEYLLRCLISTHACFQADTNWLEQGTEV